MLRGSIIERDKLLLFLAGERSPRAESLSLEDVKLGVDVGSYALIWESTKLANSGSRPVIVVADSDIREFFSFVGTYVNAYVPFTAFFRVISHSQFVSAKWVSSPSNYRKEDFVVQQRLIGLAIAEAALTKASGPKKVDSLTVSDIKFTLSSSLLSALFALGDSAPLRDIAGRWTFVLDRFVSPKRSLAEDVLRVFDSFIPFDGSNKQKAGSIQSVNISQVVSDVAARGAILDFHWAALAREAPDIASAYQSLRGPREDRIKALSATLTRIRDDSGRSAEYAACLAGCTLALVGEGSFQYLPLALEMSEDPLVVMWFAGWSSLISKTDALTIGNALGMRAARDVFVQDDLYSSPTADASFEEFVIHGLPLISNGRSSSPDSFTIEIYPTIYSHFRPAQSKEADQGRLEGSSLRFVEEAQQYLDRARYSLRHALEGQNQNKSRSRSRE